MGRRRPELHVTDPSNKRTEETTRQCFFWGKPGPRRGCSVTDGLEKKNLVLL